VIRDGKRYTQSFERGVAKKPKIVNGPKTKHGTTVTFTPDPQIFGKKLRFNMDTIRERIRTKAYLTPGVAFTLNGEVFKFNGGLVDLLGDQLEAGDLVAVTEFPFSLEEDGLQVALTWTEDPRSSDELVHAFANGIPTRDGGTHISGLKAGVSEAVKEWMVEAKLWPKRPAMEAQDIREGLAGAIHVFVQNPQFQGQTKDRLNNPEVKGTVRSVVRKGLLDWLRSNSKQSQALAQRVIDAAKARTASRAARDQVRRKTVTKTLALPGKLADCSSSELEETELFLVEGDSAGGSAKQGRNRVNQAVLALRGKVINSIRENPKRVSANAEIKDLIDAVGTGMGRQFDMEGLRYGKVILLMDADVDGHHISTLVLAFLYEYMRPLIDAGRVYLAQPPLYRINSGSESFWAADDAERDDFIRSLPKKRRGSVEISYFKGLGEMPPKVLFETTMDPSTRRLLRVSIPDGKEVETAVILNDLLGSDSEMRVAYMMESA
jgi:DNA gyrase subunit B